MRQKTITSLILILAILVTGNLMAQINSRQGGSELQERLNTVVKHKLEIRQATPTQLDKSILDYCIPSGNCSNGEGFIDFIFAGIENLASGCSPNGYGDFTFMQGTAEIGYTYTASITTGQYPHYVSMWIDFNDDEVFSEMERILTDFYVDIPNVMTDIEIIIPGAAAPGIHRLRVGASYAFLSSPDPCAEIYYGEWEDYNIEITGAPISYNAGVSSIDMGSVMFAGDIIPMATVTNYGMQTVSFPVTMTEPTTGYSSTVEIVDLAMDQTQQVEFDTWTVEVGIYDIEVCTDLIGDEIPDNDCKDMALTFYDHPRQKVVAELFTGMW